MNFMYSSKAVKGFDPPKFATLSKAILLVFFFCASIFSQEIFAQCTSATSPGNTTITWAGSDDTDWNNPCNWNPLTVPIATDSVVIPQGAIRYPVIISPAFARTIRIFPNTTLVVNAPLTISRTTTGFLLNNGGTITNSSVLTFIGDSTIPFQRVDNDGTIINNGDVVLEELYLVNFKSFTNSGTLKINAIGLQDAIFQFPNAELINTQSGIMDLSGADLYGIWNQGNVENSGKITASAGRTGILNDGSLTNRATGTIITNGGNGIQARNNSTNDNYGYINILDNNLSFALKLSNGTIINNYPCAEINAAGPIQNEGTINNQGLMTVNFSSGSNSNTRTFTNEGILDNNPDIPGVTNQNGLVIEPDGSCIQDINIDLNTKNEVTIADFYTGDLTDCNYSLSLSGQTQYDCADAGKTFTLNLDFNSGNSTETICTATVQVVDAATIESIDIENPILCNGNQTKVTVTASGLIDSYTIDGLVTANESVSGNELTFDAKPFFNSETYTVTLFNAAGCSDQTTFELTNGPTVEAALAYIDPPCVGDTVCFKFTGTAGASATFDWDLDDGTIVSTSAKGDTVCVIFPLREESVRWIGVTVSMGGCSDYAQTGVNVTKPPTALAGDDKEICFGEKTTLSGAALNNNAVNCWWEPAVFPGNDVPNCDSPEVMPDVTTDYVFWVCDNNNCKDSDTVRVNVEKVPAEIEALNEICSGTSTTLSAKDADDVTYDYEWFIGATSVGTGATLTTENLIAETTYILKVTNPNSNCMTAVEHTISILELPMATISGNNVICLNDETTLTISATSGSGGYSYAWSNGAATEAITVNPNETTDYTVEVTDSKGCQATTSVTVTVNSLPVADAGDDQLICEGFDATLTGTGAGAGGAYNWNPGDFDGAIYVVSPISTATYTVKVTDTNGCMDEDIVLVTVDKATAEAGDDQTICEGESATLTASGDPDDTNTFLWSPGGETTASITVNPIITTTYTVEVTNENGCKKTDDVTVNVNPTPQLDITGETVICLGDPANLAATSGYVEYLWTNDKNSDQATTTSIEVTPTETTTYTVEIIDDNGCKNTATHTVTVNPLPTPSIMADGELKVSEHWVCRGSTVTLEGLGGTSYEWTTNGTSGNVADPAVVSQGASDAFIEVYVGEDAFIFFTLKVTDANGCMDTKDFYIKTWENPVVETMPQGIKLCPNSGTMIMANALGGSPEYTWMWTKDITGGIIETPAENMTNVYPSATTIYTVKATDQNGCMGTSDLLVEVKPEATAQITGNNVCLGEDIILTASGGGNYTWEDGSTDNPRTVATTASGVLTFSVTVAGGPQGCILSTATASTDITVSDFPTPAIAGNLQICYGETTTLTASGAGAGGTYLWENGESTAEITTAALTENITYSVVVTNAAGCATSTDVEVIVNPLPEPIVEAASVEICKGESTTLSVTGTYATYEWSVVGNATVLGTDPTLSVTPDANTNYSVKVTDANGCSGQEHITILVNPLPTPEIITTPLDICLGGSVNLGVVGGDTYLWEDNSTDPNRIVTPATVGDHIYTVIATLDNGCSASASVTVTVAPKPTAAISGITDFCEGGSTTLTASGGETYLWSTGEIDAEITVTEGGTYSVVVTNSQGCTDMATVEVIMNTLPTVDISPDAPLLICEGEQVSLTANASGGSGSYSYSWNDLFTTNSITVSPLQTAEYTLKVTDSNGCMATKTREIKVSPLPIANAGDDVLLCANADATLTATGGTTYEWRIAGNSLVLGTDASISVSPSSTVTYEVTVFNEDGCMDTDDVTVTIGGDVTVDAGADQTICQGETATIIATATGATILEWTTGATGNTIDVMPNETTTYKVVAKNDQGCSDYSEVTIFVNNPPTVDISEDATICSGDELVITADGGTGATYEWTPSGATTASITISPTQTVSYKVVVTKNGCSSEATQLTTVIPAASVTALDQTVCSGSTTTLTASDGDSYLWTPGGETTQSISATTGTYSVDVTTILNGKTCTSTASTTIDEYTPVSLAIRITDASGIPNDYTICNGDEVVFESVFASGDFSEVYWTATTNDSDNGTVSFLDANGFVTNGTVTNSGTIVDEITVSLHGKDLNGCWQIVTKTLYANPALTLSTEATPAGGSVCYDDEVTLTATPSGGNAPFTFNWNAPNFDLSDETGTSVTYNPLNDNVMHTVSVTATDNNGCAAQSFQNVEGVSEIIITLTPDLDCNGQSHVIINVTGGIPDVFGGYLLSINGSTPQFRQLADLPWNFPISNNDANFSVSVEDSRNCTTSESTDIVFDCTDFCGIVTSGGEISNDQQICAGQTPSMLVETEAPTMTESGTLEYIWLASTTGCPTSTSQAISGATGMTYAPGTLTETTWFVRCTRVVGCTVWLSSSESNCIKIEVFQPDFCGVCDFDPTNDNTTCVDCEGTPNGTAITGASCDDGDALTENDTWDADCNCAGTLIPLDCEGTPNGNAVAGTSCDDDNPLTENDTWDNDCNCTGALIPVDCQGTPNGNAVAGTSCDDDNPLTENDTWDNDCNCQGTLIPLDCEGTPNGNAVAGTSCDDGNPLTENDTWDNDCNCAGTLIPLDCEGTPNGNAVAGTSCDDGNPLTENDTWDNDCNCAGTLIPLDCEGTPNGNAVAGTSCDDDNPLTENDTWDNDCNCQGTLSPVDCEGTPNGNAVAGTSCDDDNPLTENDTWDNDCNCAGTLSPVDCEGTPNGNAVAGTSCDDDNPLTENDTWDNDCNCVGTLSPVDCEGTPNGNAVAGTSCDDDNPLTENDTWDNDCNCAGTLSPVDCKGTPNGNAVAGTSCDDGNPLTENDTWDNDCNCAGTPISNGCNVAYTIDGNKITITGLTDAVTHVQITDATWNTLYLCDSWDSNTPSCGTMTMWTAPSNGTYNLFIKTYTSSWTNVCNIYEVINLSDSSDPCDGQGGDSDGDGVCDNQDCDDNNPNISSPGDACNDGNANTDNDVIQADCSCAGTPVGNNSCDATWEVNGSTISVSSLNNPVEQVQILDAGFNEVFGCNSWIGSDCGSDVSYTAPSNGTYYLFVKTYTANWTNICNIFETIQIGGGNNNVCSVSASVSNIQCQDNGTATLSDDTYSFNVSATITNGGAWGYTVVGTNVDHQANSSMGTVTGMMISAGAQTFTVIDSDDPNCMTTISVNPPDPCSNTSGCTNNVTSGGSVIVTEAVVCSGEQPAPIMNQQLPSGGTGQIEYLWLASTTGCPDIITDAIPNSNSSNYQPIALTETTYFRRCARRAGCTDWTKGETPCVKIEVETCTDPPTGDCDISIDISGNDVTVSGLPDESQHFNSVKIFKKGTSYLIGECHNWSSPTCGTSVTFDNLPIGHYTIEVLSQIDFTSDPKCSETIDFTIGSTSRMISFDAAYQTGIVQLMWTDMITTEGDDYEIEKSTDGLNFEPLINVISEESSDAPKFFQRKDLNPLAGDNFYRLKLHTVEGEELYSEIRKLRISDIEDFGLFPNPATEEVHISFRRFEDRSTTIQVVNQLGQVMKIAETDGSGFSRQTLSLRGMPSGIYTVWVFPEGMKPIGKKLIIAKK